MSVKSLLISLLLLVFAAPIWAADEPAEGKKFNPSETILHHILDTHDWHITDIPAGTDEHGHAKYTPVALHLPWLFYSS
ncbi:MAG: hypothetical protein AAFV07_11100, partial [Bacteroidota bacterium]